MKSLNKMKNLQFLAFLCLILPAMPAIGQDFDTYFAEKTVRISYLHIGNAATEKIEVDHYSVGNGWHGTHHAMTEPHRYGDILLEVFDSISGKLIFSRSYSCLFTEYRTTKAGADTVASMEECVNMPLPRQTARIRFTSYDRFRKSTRLAETWFNPQTQATRPMVKEYGFMTLHRGSAPARALDILFVPDGYTRAEKAKMRYDMKRFASYIMNCSPYKEMSGKVNIRAVKGYSEQSGITQPQNGIFRNTLVNCRYNVLGLDRYLMCPGVWNLHEVADDAPYDIIVIICNSDKYGGGGIYNFYCTVYNAGRYPDYVIVHEMGHTLGGLADEYYSSDVTVQDFYPAGIEPTEPNLTTLVDFGSKWKDMVAPGTPVPTPPLKENDPDIEKVGVFEGGGYVAKGIYRPAMHCTMKDILYNGFCPVCLKTLQEAIRYYGK